MFIFGVVNCSPDSLHQSSIVRDAAEARTRIDWLLGAGADGLDIGAQGSTAVASAVDAETEWERLRTALDLAVASAGLVSVDTWRPEVMRRAMEAGANVLNAADGMASDAAWEVAAEHRPTIVLPFLNGPDPLHLTHVVGDPLDAMIDYFEARLRVADRDGLRDRCLIDPGTGFGPAGWEWSDRYLYQRHVYRNLDRLRVFDLPLYIPVPWKDTPQHAELLDMILAQRPEYARVHEPDRVRAAERRVSEAAGLDL